MKDKMVWNIKNKGAGEQLWATRPDWGILHTINDAPMCYMATYYLDVELNPFWLDLPT